MSAPLCPSFHLAPCIMSHVMALLLLGLACHASADLGIVYALDATTVRLSASGNTSALQEPLKVAFALRQHVPATTVSDIIEDLDPWDITHSFSAGTVALMFGWVGRYKLVRYRNNHCPLHQATDVAVHPAWLSVRRDGDRN